MVDAALTHIVADYQSRPVLALNHHQQVTGVGEYDAFGFRNRVGMAAAAVAKSQDVTGLGEVALGLYFCRLAMEAHGGRIWVDEAPQFPTVFHLAFPVAPPQR